MDGLRARVAFEAANWPGWRITVVSGLILDVPEPRVYFEALQVSSSDGLAAPQRLFDGLTIAWFYETARGAVEDFDREIVFGDRPSLPPGKPRQRVNNDAWHREFGRTVDAWRSLGMTLKEIDEEVAKRLGVTVESARKYRRKAKRVIEADALIRPAAVASCSRCGGPIMAGAVAALQSPDTGEWVVYHPVSCAEKWHDRMVINPDGEVVPL